MNYAEALVECGYAKYQWKGSNDNYDIQKHDTGEAYLVEPFADTLEGIHQLFALIHWLQFSVDDGNLWVACWLRLNAKADMYSRLKECVKQCFEQLEKQE